MEMDIKDFGGNENEMRRCGGWRCDDQVTTTEFTVCVHAEVKICV